VLHLGPTRGQAHHQDGQVIHPRRRRAVQACRVRRPAAMRTYPSGAQATSRYSHGRVQPPRGATRPHGQHVPLGLLLAYCGRRRQRDRAHLRRVPVLRPQDQPPCARPPDSPCHMALRRVGVGHRRALAESARGLHPPTGCHRKVLQVGRGAPDHEPQGRAGCDVIH
jgi:hypothetical protein